MAANEKKPPGDQDFSGGDKPPFKIEAFIKRLQDRQRESKLWTLAAKNGTSIAAAWARGQDSIEVEIHAVDEQQSWAPQIVVPARLSRRQLPEGKLEFELSVAPDRLTPAERVFLTLHEPFALLVCSLEIGQFKPAVLQVGTVERVEAEPASTAQASTAPPRSDSRKTQGSYELAADAATSPAEKRIKEGPLQVVVDAQKIDVIMDRKPSHRGQPVVVETRYLDRAGQLNTSRKALSLDRELTAGEHLGSLCGAVENPLPLGCQNYEVAVRPLRADELDLLRPEQVDPLLARQSFTALTPRQDGLPFRAAATAADQRQVIADETAVWMLRVAGKEVRS